MLWIKKEYLHDLKKVTAKNQLKCVLVAVKSMQGRALMFEVYLPEYGALL